MFLSFEALFGIFPSDIAGEVVRGKSCEYRLSLLQLAYQIKDVLV